MIQNWILQLVIVWSISNPNASRASLASGLGDGFSDAAQSHPGMVTWCCCMQLRGPRRATTLTEKCILSRFSSRMGHFTEVQLLSASRNCYLTTKLRGTGDRLGEYLCVHCTNMPFFLSYLALITHPPVQVVWRAGGCRRGWGRYIVTWPEREQIWMLIDIHALKPYKSHHI